VSRVEIRIDGVDDLLADLRKLGDLSDELLVDTINDVAIATQNEAVRGIQRGPANGRTYKRGTVTHTASAPGQFPMSDTGRLASNVESILATPANIRAKVGTNIIYGAYLEFGTSKMAARPWLQRSFRQAAEGVAKELKAKLEARI
jgi:phage gpG-like protein